MVARQLVPRTIYAPVLLNCICERFSKICVCMDVCHLVVDFGYLLLHTHSSFPNHSLSHNFFCSVFPFHTILSHHLSILPPWSRNRIYSSFFPKSLILSSLLFSYISTTYYSHYFLKLQIILIVIISQRPKTCTTGLTLILNFFLSRKILNFQTVLKLTIYPVNKFQSIIPTK